MLGRDTERGQSHWSLIGSQRRLRPPLRAWRRLARSAHSLRDLRSLCQQEPPAQAVQMRRRIPAGLLALGAVAVGYLRHLRPWQLTWGAAPDEVSRVMAGDELVPRPTFNATRAISVAAHPEAIWPWLVQVGLTRAGWYSYDLLDNLGRPSARRIIPELQQLAPGDVVPTSPDGKQGLRAIRWIARTR